MEQMKDLYARYPDGLREQVVADISGGMPRAEAAKRHGVKVQTIKRWMRDVKREHTISGMPAAKLRVVVRDLDTALPDAIEFLHSVVSGDVPDATVADRIRASSAILAGHARARTADAARDIGAAVRHRMMTGPELLAKREELLGRIGLIASHGLLPAVSDDVDQS